ncbi:hypothetical protein ZWY2020_014711 [Hordeum vulgare]|nr:hypothetical protein ZWY2020_014711 [Hordeum vulgare]
MAADHPNHRQPTPSIGSEHGILDLQPPPSTSNEQGGQNAGQLAGARAARMEGGGSNHRGRRMEGGGQRPRHQTEAMKPHLCAQAASGFRPMADGEGRREEGGARFLEAPMGATQGGEGLLHLISQSPRASTRSPFLNSTETRGSEEADDLWPRWLWWRLQLELDDPAWPLPLAFGGPATASLLSATRWLQLEVDDPARRGGSRCCSAARRGDTRCSSEL